MVPSRRTFSFPSLSESSSGCLPFVHMQMHVYSRGSLNFAKVPDGQLDSATVCSLPSLRTRRNQSTFCVVRSEIPSFTLNHFLDTQKKSSSFQHTEIKSMSHGSLGGLLDEDDEVCPVECVREFKTDEEFFRILQKAKETKSLVVVDFYRTSCGSCRYIEQGFSKLCKGSGDQAGVIFLKHNVIDEYDEESEVAERLRIKAVPLFHFYKNGVLLEAFPTRDKERILSAILKYTCTSQDT